MCVYMGERAKGNMVIRSRQSRIRRHVPVRRLYVTEVIYELCVMSRSVCVAAQEASWMQVFGPIYTDQLTLRSESEYVCSRPRSFFEASWMRVFEPIYTLLFDLYH